MTRLNVYKTAFGVVAGLIVLRADGSDFVSGVQLKVNQGNRLGISHNDPVIQEDSSELGPTIRIREYLLGKGALNRLPEIKARLQSVSDGVMDSYQWLLREFQQKPKMAKIMVDLLLENRKSFLTGDFDPSRGDEVVVVRSSGNIDIMKFAMSYAANAYFVHKDAFWGKIGGSEAWVINDGNGDRGLLDEVTEKEQFFKGKMYCFQAPDVEVLDSATSSVSVSLEKPQGYSPAVTPVASSDDEGMEANREENDIEVAAPAEQRRDRVAQEGQVMQQKIAQRRDASDEAAQRRQLSQGDAGGSVLEAAQHVVAATANSKETTLADQQQMRERVAAAATLRVNAVAQRRQEEVTPALAPQHERVSDKHDGDAKGRAPRSVGPRQASVRTAVHAPVSISTGNGVVENVDESNRATDQTPAPVKVAAAEEAVQQPSEGAAEAGSVGGEEEVEQQDAALLNSSATRIQASMRAKLARRRTTSLRGAAAAAANVEGTPTPSEEEPSVPASANPTNAEPAPAVDHTQASREEGSTPVILEVARTGTSSALSQASADPDSTRTSTTATTAGGDDANGASNRASADFSRVVAPKEPQEQTASPFPRGSSTNSSRRISTTGASSAGERMDVMQTDGEGFTTDAQKQSKTTTDDSAQQQLITSAPTSINNDARSHAIKHTTTNTASLPCDEENDAIASTFSQSSEGSGICGC